MTLYTYDILYVLYIYMNENGCVEFRLLGLAENLVCSVLRQESWSIQSAVRSLSVTVQGFRVQGLEFKV